MVLGRLDLILNYRYLILWLVSSTAYLSASRVSSVWAVNDLVAVLAAERSVRYAGALLAGWHYLAGQRPHPRDRANLIPDVQLLADRLVVAMRPEHGAAEDGEEGRQGCE